MESGANDLPIICLGKRNTEEIIAQASRRIIDPKVFISMPQELLMQNTKKFLNFSSLALDPFKLPGNLQKAKLKTEKKTEKVNKIMKNLKPSDRTTLRELESKQESLIKEISNLFKIRTTLINRLEREEKYHSFSLFSESINCDNLTIDMLDAYFLTGNFNCPDLNTNDNEIFNNYEIYSKKDDTEIIINEEKTEQILNEREKRAGIAKSEQFSSDGEQKIKTLDNGQNINNIEKNKVIEEPPIKIFKATKGRIGRGRGKTQKAAKVKSKKKDNREAVEAEILKYTYVYEPNTEIDLSLDLFKFYNFLFKFHEKLELHLPSFEAFLEALLSEQETSTVNELFIGLLTFLIKNENGKKNQFVELYPLTWIYPLLMLVYDGTCDFDHLLVNSKKNFQRESKDEKMISITNKLSNGALYWGLEFSEKIYLFEYLIKRIKNSTLFKAILLEEDDHNHRVKIESIREETKDPYISKPLLQNEPESDFLGFDERKNSYYLWEFSPGHAFVRYHKRNVWLKLSKDVLKELYQHLGKEKESGVLEIFLLALTKSEECKNDLSPSTNEKLSKNRKKKQMGEIFINTVMPYAQKFQVNCENYGKYSIMKKANYNYKKNCISVDANYILLTKVKYDFIIIVETILFNTILKESIKIRSSFYDECLKIEDVNMFLQRFIELINALDTNFLVENGLITYIKSAETPKHSECTWELPFYIYHFDQNYKYYMFYLLNGMIEDMSEIDIFKRQPPELVAINFHFKKVNNIELQSRRRIIKQTIISQNFLCSNNKIKIQSKKEIQGMGYNRDINISSAVQICFKCRLMGDLLSCANCPASYHQVCNKFQMLNENINGVTAERKFCEECWKIYSEEKKKGGSSDMPPRLKMRMPEFPKYHSLCKDNQNINYLSHGIFEGILKNFDRLYQVKLKPSS